MSTVTERPHGATEFEAERLSPALIERANAALLADEWPDARPSEQMLRDLCSDCDAYGLIGSGRYASACRHRMGVLVWIVQAEGVPVAGRKVA